MPARNSKIRSAKAPQKPNVSVWIQRETHHQRKALETASRHFDRNDAMDIYTLEAVYAQESNFGQNRGKRNSAGAAGDFQIKKRTAQALGLKVSGSKFFWDSKMG